jgi:hypothetical protein
MMLWGINPRFHGLSPCIRQVAYALRTRAPLATRPKPVLPLDLHVLSLPLAFILSQDQTLRCNYKSLIISFAQVNPLQKSTKLVHLAFFYAFVKILKNSFFTKNQHRFSNADLLLCYRNFSRFFIPLDPSRNCFPYSGRQR